MFFSCQSNQLTITITLGVELSHLTVDQVKLKYKNLFVQRKFTCPTCDTLPKIAAQHDTNLVWALENCQTVVQLVTEILNISYVKSITGPQEFMLGS